jgi:hypothetical protein
LINIISQKDFDKNHQIIYWISICLIFVIVPTLWPFLYLWAAKLKYIKKLILVPYSQPWDYVFSQKRALWVIVHLKNGDTIRGKYSMKSMASAYPKEKQIYIQELWQPGDNGGFKRKIDRSEGVILFESEISFIEFYK